MTARLRATAGRGFRVAFLALLAAAWGAGCGSGRTPAPEGGATGPTPEPGSGAATLPSSAPPVGAHNVLLITVDTLRADHLSCYGHDRPTSPRLDALAREGVRFARAQAQRSLTTPSLASILTSRYPRTHLVRRNAESLDPSAPTLSRILRARGWRAAAFLAPRSTMPDPGLDETFNAEPGAPQPVQDRQVTRAAVEWLERHKGGPFFAWIHYIGPHDPYRPEPPHDTLFDPGYDGSYNGEQETINRIIVDGIDLAPRDLAHIVALYDGEIRATDGQIGEVLDALARLGLARSTLVVVTADHGEELYQRNHYFLHGCSVYDAALHVPLLMRLPGVLEAGAVVEPLVELIDIMPTVLGLEGLPAPPGVEGIDLTPLLTGAGAGRPAAEARPSGAHAAAVSGTEASPDEAPPPWPVRAWVGSGRPLPEDRFVGGERFSVAEYRDKILTLRTGEWRYVHNPEGYRPRGGPYRIKPGHPGYAIGREELYRTCQDPLERRNVISEHPETAAQLRDALLRWAAGRPNVMRERVLDDEAEQELRSLGYVH